MTYVSRRTRIILSRWTDECDAEYILRACRKRSDGRLKKHSSCDDLRAWVRDDCINNEYLVDLMSDGEFLGKPPFRLYGRFIPVPILFKLMQNSTKQNRESETQEKDSSCTGNYAKDNLKSESNSNEDSKLKGNSSLTRIQWEKNLLEQHLVKCTDLLNVAFEKLEKVDVIVGLAYEEIENARNEEIQEVFYTSKLKCTCSQHRSLSAHSNLKNFSENLSFSKFNLKALRDSAKCTELRKISSLMEKLKKIQELEQEILFRIRASQKKSNKCSSPFQVTELYSRREQAQVKRIQKKYKKLISEKKRLLFEMCQTLTALNALKRSSKSYLNFQRRQSIPKKHSRDSRGEEVRESVDCDCGYKYTDNYESSDSEKLQCSDSTSIDSDSNKKFESLQQMDEDLRYNLKNYAKFPLKKAVDCGDLNLEHFSNNNLAFSTCTTTVKMDSKFSESRSTLFDKYLNKDRKPVPSNQKKFENAQKKKEIQTPAKKSKVKFICEESSCRKKFYADELAAFENSLSPEQQKVIQKAVQNVRNIQSSRPNTSPTTRRENQVAALESKLICKNASVDESCRPFARILGRRVKSETSMKEIEKTLRNYEQRLCDLNSLECKLEVLKEKSSEAYRLRKKLTKVKAETRKQRVADKEKFNSDITRLCSENWELKRQIQQLTAKFDAQNQKIQNLKCSVLKARELECEAEELKKELSECRDSFEHQRKCISRWESVVAVQRTEIENLMNHIRKLTTTKEEAQWSPCQDKRYIQRSRSYSPEKSKERVMICRPKTQVRVSRFSSEEEEICSCKDYRQQEERRKSQLRGFDRGYYSQTRDHVEWCN